MTLRRSRMRVPTMPLLPSVGQGGSRLASTTFRRRPARLSPWSMATRTIADVLPPRYTSVVLLARGGMGEIYEACDSALGRSVAVKVLAEGYANDPALRWRVTREALAAARLSNHAHTVTIFDVGEWRERPYIVM